MRVCLATTSFPRWENDHRVPFMLELARELKHQGHLVRVVGLHTPGAKTREVIDGIEVIRARYLPESWEVLQKEDGGIPAIWRKKPFARLALLPFAIVFLAAIIRYSKDCDIIHANWSLSGLLAWAGKIFHRKPYIVTVHGSDIFMGGSIPFVSKLTACALNASKGTIAVSHSLAEAVKQLGVRPEKVFTIPNGVNLDRFHPANGDRKNHVLFVGNLTENKGVRYLIEAFPYVLSCIPDVRLIVIGGGPQKESFEAAARRQGIADRVIFLGSKSPQEVADWMRSSQLFVLPSLSEGFGVVLLEAMASGLPCIGTRTGGIPDIITPEIGRLVPPADSQALGEAVVEMLRDREGLERMRKRAVVYVREKYSWTAVVRQITALYQ